MSIEFAIPEDLSIPDWLKRPKGIGAPAATICTGSTNAPGLARAADERARPSNLNDRDRAAIAEIIAGQTGTNQIKTSNRIKKMLTNKGDKGAARAGKRWDQQRGKWV